MSSAILIRRPQICNAISHQSKYVGTQYEHTKCERCNQILSSIHSFTSDVNWSSDHTSATKTSTCDCGYSTSEIQYASKNWITYASCSEQGKYDYKVTWDNGESTRCPDYHYSAKLSHTSVYGGTSSAHTKCSSCGTILSSTHDSWDSSLSYSTSWNSSHDSCTMYQSCSCGYSQGFAATISTVSVTPSTCSTNGSYNHKALSPTGEVEYCGTTHTLSSYDSSNHEALKTQNISDGLSGHRQKTICESCNTVISTGSLNSHSYSNLSSVSSTRHIGSCNVCGYAAYQNHYAADKPKSTAVALDETWLCEGCNYDTGKSVLSTGSSTSGFTSPFSYTLPPSWTN